MQVITTDKGKFIATMDFNWKPYIETTVIATTKASAGYNWLTLKSLPKVAVPIKTVTKKAELPANYDINDTPELKQIYDYIKQGEPITFLTGGAGTGKSTFINYLKNNLHEETGKNCVVLAPTGIAAINIDGETIHHFFRFPLDPFENKDIKKSQKNPILDYTDLIIIDEVSMVASWMIDHIDYALRLWCDNTKAFGGKQLLLIGDCFQLPPIIDYKKSEMKKFAEKWRSPFFFDAKSLDNVDIKCVSLRKIYRQQEDTFMHMLNRIRTCKTGYEKDIAFLNEKCLIESRFRNKKCTARMFFTQHKKI